MRISQHAKPLWATVSSTRPRTWNKEQACYYVEQYHGMLHRELWICFGSFEEKRNQEELYKWYTKLYSATLLSLSFLRYTPLPKHKSRQAVPNHDVSPHNLILNNFSNIWWNERTSPSDLTTFSSSFHIIPSLTHKRNTESFAEHLYVYVHANIT
jgi:hypothetical protein